MFDDIKKEMTVLLDMYPATTGLFLSGGADSLLLLHLLLDLRYSFSIVTFDQSFTKAQRKHIDNLIYTHDLRVFSYPPSNAYLMGDGKRLAVAEEYSMLDGFAMPFIRDFRHDESVCAVLDVKFGPFVPIAPVGFLLNIFGIRKHDRHWVTGKVGTQKILKPGQAVYYNPLWDLTRRDVEKGLKYYNDKPPKIDTGELPMCLNCLCGSGKVYCPRVKEDIDSIQWNPRTNLQAFRKQYGYLRG